MSGKPSYLGLLNAIAVGEARGYQLLSAWGDNTKNRELAAVLNLVAIRENEHARVFEKRLSELGFTVREAPSEKFDADLEYANSDASDDEKFRRVLGFESETNDERPDPLRNLFTNESIDPQTGALLGRFIAEEYDSGRRLRDAWENFSPDSGKEVCDNDELLLQEIAERLDRLTTTIEEFKAARK